ncbi:unnamed protein product [Ranitomeya imitator]|uniref:Uncharacterized protein n=1 Tax=Ranitomeya imitator TaxID=111125 RepID=A0ABN9LVF7_9NEOB|nr:unnamed protein product [Ranitomeya imitator]
MDYGVGQIALGKQKVLFHVGNRLPMIFWQPSGHNAGFGEAWDECLKDAEPVDVVSCLQKVKVEKGKELGTVGRH